MKIKTLSLVLNIAYLLIAVLFFLDQLISFDIKYQPLKTIVYIGILVATPFILVWNLLTTKKLAVKIAGLIVPIITIILIIIYGPMKFLFSSGSWRTQTVLYQNGHLSFKKIEFQMQDVGGLGYNKRTVEVLYLTPLLMIVSEPPPDIDKRVEWVKVNKDVNELELK